MSIQLNRHTPWWQGIIYGLSSMLDGWIMVGSFGMLIGTYRHDCSLWIAKRYARKGAVQ